MSKILLADDDANILRSFQMLLSDQDYTVVTVDRGDLVLPALQRENPDLLISDINMPGLTGLQALKQIREAHQKLPVIIMTGQGTMATAIEAMRCGAFEYMLKPFEPDKMLETIERALAVSRLMHTPVQIDPTQETPVGDVLIGQSPGIQEVFKSIGRVTGTEAAVLIRGENGTGKELVARAVYQFSTRSKGPLIVVNCAAIPDTLLESEFFGHEKGAFTGADQRRIGRFEQADGGTIFLDEIGDIPLGTQAKLLRVLQEKTLERVGGREQLKVNVRVISATNRDLEKALAEGKFREDLFHRLNVFTIRLPALRERPGDVPRLVNYFIQRFAIEMKIDRPALPADALDLLQHYGWPGNVRELQHCVQRAMILSKGYPLSADAFRQALAQPAAAAPAHATVATAHPPASASNLLRSIAAQMIDNQAAENRHEVFMDQADKALLLAALEKSGNNQTQAAKLLGLSRQAIQMKMNKYQIER
ncbi:MAG TPA: sigma-54 dependent transcriptional regulator [Planctomycetota bacterium]|nr:sigma-54 dependent transcriptional regulator [Planctomycetota bacterium]